MNAAARTVVWRTVFPVADTDAVLPLYIDGDASRATVIGRHALAVAAGGTVSLGSYFNSFPAAYWRAETDAASVRMTAATRGVGTLTVLRSDAGARASVVERRRVEGDVQTSLDVPLGGFGDGGACWLDLEAGHGGLELRSADWSVPGSFPATATIVIATFDRPADCLTQLRTLAGDPGVPEVVDRIVVVDQGTDRVSDRAGFDKVASSLGDRLVIVPQRNLGGSGGYSRGMLEALRRAESDFVLLLDDDAISEPEAIVRAIRFADAARAPIIVGGGMLHLDDRAVLYVQSEQWDDRIGWIRLGRPDAYDHDLAAVPFRRSPQLHRVQRSDFNGWWMCLIPLPLLREAGLSMPVFLNGDDVEFALRAREHGVRTVSVPGIALWHLGWGRKAPTRTWMAYFLHRNRLITELLHARRRRPTAAIVHSFLGDVKPLLMLQYSTARLRAQAIADVLAGPEPLTGWLDTRAAEVRTLWRQFADATPVEGMTAPDAAPAPPAGRIRQAVVLTSLVARHLLVPARASAHVRPQAHVAAGQLGWWTFARLDSALVATADGRSVVWCRRDRRETSRALWRSIRLHLRLWARWPRLTRRFRAAAPELASPAAWSRTFAR